MLETKIAERKNATSIELSGGACVFEHRRREKICELDVGRADRCWTAFGEGEWAYPRSPAQMPTSVTKRQRGAAIDR